MYTTLFPTLKGLEWDIKLSPEFFGIEQKAITPGYDTEISFGPDPIYHFEMNYSVLRETIQTLPSTYFDERHTLQNFFEYTQGKTYSFLMYLPSFTQNPKDGTTLTASNGTGPQTLTVDSNNLAPIQVARAYTPENIYEIAGVNSNPGTPPVVKFNGVTKTAGVDYNIVGPGYSLGGSAYSGMVLQCLTTVTTPVTIDFTWYYRVRFEQSKQEFNLFVYLLWEAQKVQLIQTRT